MNSQLGWILAPLMAVATFNTGSAAAADLQFFQTSVLKYKSTAFAWGSHTVIRAEGSFYAMSCGAFSELEGAEVVFEADGTVFSGTLTHGQDNLYLMTYQDALRSYKVVINPDKNFWRFEYTGRDANLLHPPDVTVSFIIDGQGGSESLTLSPDPSGLFQWVLVPETAEMTCFGANDFTFEQAWNAWGHTRGYLNIHGRYRTSDCDQAWMLGITGTVMLSMDHTVLAVDAANMTRNDDWYHTWQTTPGGKWELHINTRSGLFWATVYDPNLDLVDPTDGVELALLVGDQIGFENIIVMGGATDAYHTHWGYVAASPACQP